MSIPRPFQATPGGAAGAICARVMRPVAMICTALTLTLWGPTAVAQNLFAPVVKVNDRVITAFERDQRARMLTLFRTPGDPREEAVERLIDERLQLAEAARLGITVNDRAIATGMTEFASRANLSPEDFIAALAQAGVDEATFRDFVAAGVAWRQVVRARFGRSTDISEAEIDRALAVGSGQPGLRLLLSEIVLPTDTPARRSLAERRAFEIAKITTLPSFARAAQEYSAAPSSNRGGRINWVDQGNLPPPVAAAVASLSPGDVAGPIRLPNAIAFFQVRGREETGANVGQAQMLEYAAFYIPGGRTEAALGEAAAIRARVDTCDDLYGVAQGLPADRLQRDSLPIGQVPTDVALELARLDIGEVSTALTRAGGQTLIFLMLCDRTNSRIEVLDRTDIREQLLNRRLAGQAANYLAELRANATIAYP